MAAESHGMQQERKWRSMRSERKQTVWVMDASGMVRNTPFPSL
jgi:hypothetical protein